MSFSKRLLAIPAIAFTASAWAYAPSLSGIWAGHVKFDTKGMSAQQVSQMQQFTKMTITLTLKADHTFSIASPGGRPAQAGKWTASGSTVTMTGARGQSQKFTLAPNGKTLFLVRSAQNKMGPKFDFSFTKN